jgi:hypothetical protein
MYNIGFGSFILLMSAEIEMLAIILLSYITVSINKERTLTEHWA